MTHSRTVALVACGGTIGASLDRGGFLPAEALVAAYALQAFLPETLSVRSHAFDSRSSTEWTPADALALAQRLAHLRADAAPHGMVVTFGTGTLEETAYLAQLVWKPDIPVVFTAAMLPHGHPQSDGAGNLRDALLVAASGIAAGVYVVLQGEIHDPRELSKNHASRIRAFASPEFGPLGCIEEGRVRVFRSPPSVTARAIAACSARVELVKCYQGMGASLLAKLGPADLDGLVVESLASGQVPPRLVPELVRLVDEGVHVALSTRCAMGRLRLHEAFPVAFPGDEQQLMRAGCLRGFEAGIKVRLRLLVGLSAGLQPGELRAWLEAGYRQVEV